MSKKNHDNLKRLLAGRRWRTLAVGGCLPLVVGMVAENACTLCHIGQEAGVCQRAPEVVFLLRGGNARPVLFINDYLEAEYATVPGVFGYVPVKPHLQSDLDRFVLLWFQTLKEQGFFEQAKTLAEKEKALSRQEQN